MAEGDKERIGPYVLHEVLGEGGMGTVYRALQTEPVSREVALKIIKPGMDTREVVARFQAERQALALMNHPGIATVYEAGETNAGRPYFVMELVRGVAIDEYCDTHKLSTAERVSLAISVCDAVHHAHQKGVIHRDLKPSNILVSVDDAGPTPKVIDFGIAKAVAAGSDGLVTTMGQMLGTPAYMSPEQAERSGLDVDTRTDVYSLGVILYELLSGTLPFDSETLKRPDFIVQFLIREREVPTPSVRLADLANTQNTVARNRRTDVRALRRELRGDLDWIVMKAMEKDRTRRYAAASELAADLRRYLGGDAVLARPPSAGYRIRKLARRHRGALAAGMALLISLVVGAAVSTVGFLRAEENAQEAAAQAARAEAVNAFLGQMLQAADPVAGDGPETTVREVLDAASDEVSDGALEAQPLVEASVRRSIGASYMQLGLLDEAEDHFSVARELLDDHGGDASDRVEALDELGQVARRQGRLADAEAFYRAALNLADSAGFTTDAGAGEDLVNGVRADLALTLQNMDRLDEAAAILEELASSHRRLLPVDDLDRATTLNNLALVRSAAGDVEGAIGLFEETLTSLTAALGPSHLYVAAVLESIGSLHQRLGRYPEADSLRTAAQDMRRELVGEGHPHYQNGLAGLGLLRLEMGDREAAETLLLEAVALAEELLGPEHPRVATSLHSLGLVYLEAEAAEDAEEVFRRALEIREAALGPDHRNTLNARSSLAGALLLGGQAEEAESLAAAVVARQRALGVGDGTLVGAALRIWGGASAELGRFEVAEEALLEAYEIQSAELGDEHRQTVATVESLVKLYTRWGRDDLSADWQARLR